MRWQVDRSNKITIGDKGYEYYDRKCAFACNLEEAQVRRTAKVPVLLYIKLNEGQKLYIWRRGIM